MRRIKWLVPVLAIVMLVGMAPEAKAQVERPWALELYGGVFVPLGPSEWTGSVKTSAGIGVAISYQFTPRLYLLGQGTWGLVTGATVNDTKQPNVDFFGYFLAGAYDFTAGKSVSVLGQLGVGANTLEGEGGGSSNTYFAANGGLKFYYHINPSVGLTLNALAVATLAKKEDFGGTETGTQIIWNLPISAGFIFRF